MPEAIPTSTVSRETGRAVVAFLSDDATAAAVRSGLAALGDDLDIRPGMLWNAVRYFEQFVPGRAAIIDIGGAAHVPALLAELARLCPPGVRLILLGGYTEASFNRQVALGAGVTAYLPKPITPGVVRRFVMPHLVGDEEAASPATGRVVAVCGARGGTGASSIALNLAVALTDAVKGEVALVDFHLPDGELALMLNARPGAGLRPALEDAARVDDRFLERAAIAVAPRLRLIAAAGSYEEGPAVTQAGVARVLDVLRRTFEFIVVDTPIPIPAGMRPLLLVSEQVIAVLTPDVAGLRDTRAIRHLVTRASDAARVITLLNRSDMAGGLPADLVQKGLGAKPDIVVPELGKGMLEAINLGVPAVRRVSGLRHALAPLVRDLTGTAPPRHWLDRLLRR